MTDAEFILNIEPDEDKFTRAEYLAYIERLESIAKRLEDDEWEKIKSTCTHELTEDGKLREI